jgi:hypothetical protein
MNSKGQGFGFIRVLFVGGFFLLMFALALAPFIAGSIGGLDLTDWGVFGAWVVGHLAVWVFGVFCLAILIALVFGVFTGE